MLEILMESLAGKKMVVDFQRGQASNCKFQNSCFHRQGKARYENMSGYVRFRVIIFGDDCNLISQIIH